ncbi:hypothetical protein UFOVP1009_25 [uncultured Caudovirales phage]|uniref:Uncharacterized protein n=1 Tax=uncultured Caudovirales phage TaxID=2100421 RepID=A0A6J5Q917_9CAUD|nr:hypothetical protein UFOVP1009_25 [uncultured Caudovirales phage]
MAKKLSDLALTIDPFSQINDTQFGFGASLGSLYNAGGSNEISSPRSWASIAKQSATPTIPEIQSTQTPSSSDSTPNKDVAPAQDLAPPVDNAPNPYLPPAIDFTTPELPPINADLTPDLTGIKVPPVDVVTPDLTGIKVPPADVVTPDLTGIKVPPVDVVAPDLTKIEVPPVPPVDTGVDLSAPVLPKFDGPDFSKVGKALDEFLNPAKKELDKINIDLGIPPGLMDNASLKLGDPTKFGQIGVPGTGGYIDVSDKSNELYDEVVVGTPLEGVSADDVLSLVRDPKQFVIDKGSDVAAEAINNMTGGGADSLLGGVGATGEVIANLLKGTPIGEVTGDIAKKAIVDTTRTEIIKQFGNDAGGAAAKLAAGILEGENADQIAIDIAKNAIEKEAIKQGGELVGGSAVAILDGILKGEKATEIIADVGTLVIVNVIGTAVDAVVPGLGTLLKIALPFLLGGDPQEEAKKRAFKIEQDNQFQYETQHFNLLESIKNTNANMPSGDTVKLLLSGKPGSVISKDIIINDIKSDLLRHIQNTEFYAERGIKTLMDDKIKSVTIEDYSKANKPAVYDPEVLYEKNSDYITSVFNEYNARLRNMGVYLNSDGTYTISKFARDSINEKNGDTYSNSPTRQLALLESQKQHDNSPAGKSLADAARKAKEEAAQKAKEEYDNSQAGKLAGKIAAEEEYYNSPAGKLAEEKAKQEFYATPAGKKMWEEMQAEYKLRQDYQRAQVLAEEAQKAQEAKAQERAAWLARQDQYDKMREQEQAAGPPRFSTGGSSSFNEMTGKYEQNINVGGIDFTIPEIPQLNANLTPRFISY